jgi:ubiquinone/menaquinone biosynthesis C-methylase UbiE
MIVFLDLLSPKKDDVILEIGAGTGWLANQVANICDDTYALEPDEGKLEYMKKKFPQVKAFSATASSVPFPDKYFSKAYMVGVFHHFENQSDSLEEIARLLRHDGKLLIHERDISSSIGARLEARFNKHVRFSSPEELVSLAEDHGFSVSWRPAKRGYFVSGNRTKSH